MSFFFFRFYMIFSYMKENAKTFFCIFLVFNCTFLASGVLALEFRTAVPSIDHQL